MHAVYVGVYMKVIMYALTYVQMYMCNAKHLLLAYVNLDIKGKVQLRICKVRII